MNGYRVRLIRRVDRPTGRGPGNGQFALQRALRRRNVPWLAVGGALCDGEIPWYWCWLDRHKAAACAEADRPFVVGPNVLFEDSRRPCAAPGEAAICTAASCKLMFTESEWYRRLIEKHQGRANRAPIILWPYPIEPKPGGPLPPTVDLLLYAKRGYDPTLVADLRRTYRRSKTIRYGRYRREQLFEAARRSRACVYLSDDDRGPLALAEILLAGCPSVGVAGGAPFVEHGRTGILLEWLTRAACVEAIEDCLEFDREEVAARAAEKFDTGRIVDTVLGALAEVSVGIIRRGA